MGAAISFGPMPVPEGMSFHLNISLFEPAENKVAPSGCSLLVVSTGYVEGSSARERMPIECPDSVCSFMPEDASHMTIVASEDPDIRMDRVGVIEAYCIAFMKSRWPDVKLREGRGGSDKAQEYIVFDHAPA